MPSRFGCGRGGTGRRDRSSVDRPVKEEVEMVVNRTAIVEAARKRAWLPVKPFSVTSSGGWVVEGPRRGDGGARQARSAVGSGRSAHRVAAARSPAGAGRGCSGR